jgi:DNA invertase Pin-like site-specific DNA recombinase
MDAYLRVSRRAGREGDAYRSPDLQLQDIERWAKGNGVTLGKVVKEEDVSGARPVVHRGLEELIQRAQRGESRGVLVHRIDRFGRTTPRRSSRRSACATREHGWSGLPME